jgi:hypothetical protein
MNQSPIINEFNEIELNEFKNKVKKWLSIDSDIEKLQNKIKELKITKKKIEPEITSFMVNYNISDLNTDKGKIKYNERKTKKPLNKINIRNNLSQVINDDSQIDQAMQLIMNNRETKITHILSKPKMNNIKKNELPI